MNANQIERQPTPLECVMHLHMTRDFALSHGLHRVLVTKNIHRQNYHLQGFPMKIDERMFFLGINAADADAEDESAECESALPMRPLDLGRQFPDNEPADVVYQRLCTYVGMESALKDFRQLSRGQMADKGEALKDLIFAVVILLQNEGTIVTIDQVLNPAAPRMGHSDTRIMMRWMRPIYQHFMALDAAAKKQHEQIAEKQQDQIDHRAGMPSDELLKDLPDPIPLHDEDVALAADTANKLGDASAPIAMGHPYAPYPGRSAQAPVDDTQAVGVTMKSDGSIDYYPV